MICSLLALHAIAQTPSYVERDVVGWKVHIRKELAGQPLTNKAVELLSAQLAEVERVVPKPAVDKLKAVQLWFSPEYEGDQPRAAYHPAAKWLKDHGRDPAMARGIEFSNIRIFEAETRRMPNFALHELAHAYHDQVLPRGFSNPDVKAAYESAAAGGGYGNVERQDARGKRTKAKAYAMTNPQEYFAELSEAYFSTNDFFPFNWGELVRHDPTGLAMLKKAWKIPDVSTPPASLKAPDFYTKFFDANGYPVIASSGVNDYALKEAGYLIDLMLAKRQDLKAVMVEGGSRMVVMAHNEFTTDIPEYKDLKPKDFWDARARGLGGSETDPICSCAEENVLGYQGDPYAAECIVIHEFAHNIHLRGLVALDEKLHRSSQARFDYRLKQAYEEAMKKGLWKGKYASTNHHEYFAEGVQSWFDNNRENDADHNHVNTRAELIEYDPGLAALCKEVFGDTELRYTKPVTRLTGHLRGYEPSKAPRFEWPKRLDRVRADIREQSKKRGGG